MPQACTVMSLLNSAVMLVRIIWVYLIFISIIYIFIKMELFISMCWFDKYAYILGRVTKFIYLVLKGRVTNWPVNIYTLYSDFIEQANGLGQGSLWESGQAETARQEGKKADQVSPYVCRYRPNGRDGSGGSTEKAGGGAGGKTQIWKRSTYW